MAAEDAFHLQPESDRFAATPASISQPSKARKEFAACLASGGNRVVLSGIGGDEVLGGVPTPTPELADLLVRARFPSLAHRLKLWALSQRRPWLHLLWETARGFMPLVVVGVSQDIRPAPWLCQDFVRRHRRALTAYMSRLKVFGPLPSFQENISTLKVLRRQLESSGAVLALIYEKRYPYLDRDLLQFLFAAPRQQVVRLGERRSLMRRALAGIVPGELLDRKRKAFLKRSPLMALAGIIDEAQQTMKTATGIIVPERFAKELLKAKEGREVASIAIMRTLVMELWCRKSCEITMKNSRPRYFKSKGGEDNEIHETTNPIVM